MSFRAIHENKIFMKICGFTVICGKKMITWDEHMKMRSSFELLKMPELRNLLTNLRALKEMSIMFLS